jgi:hypothetical protein
MKSINIDTVSFKLLVKPIIMCKFIPYENNVIQLYLFLMYWKGGTPLPVHQKFALRVAIFSSLLVP